MKGAVEIHSVSKRYGDVEALINVSLTVSENMLFGLIGPDGAGKTTLYRILTTLVEADSGTASVLGMDVKREYRNIRASIGYMPDRFSLYPDLTVEENLIFFASLFGVKVSDNYSFIEPFFGQLSKFLDRKAGNLSGGMKQKLALGCALIHRPRLLLLDEPTTGVDAVSRSEFWESLRELKDMGVTVLVSTSYMDEAGMCEKVALINHGRILQVDSPDVIAASADKHLYEASATEMYLLLEKLRAMPEVKMCYTFGATLHMVAGDNFDATVVCGHLRADGLKDVRIAPVHGTIEDKFIQLDEYGE